MVSMANHFKVSFGPFLVIVVADCMETARTYATKLYESCYTRFELVITRATEHEFDEAKALDIPIHDVQQ